MFRAVGFDVGDTLLYYAGTPLDWSSCYSDALSAVAKACRVAPNMQELAAASDVLRGYNTRVHPRTDEVAAEKIFSRILSGWSVRKPKYLRIAVDSFFTFFQQRMCPFPETLDVLRALRVSGLRLGALTDVPYGMPQRFVERDLDRAQVSGLLEAVVTSMLVGRRKPAADGYVALARLLGVRPDEMLYVGNEPKDVLGATQAGVPSAFLDRTGQMTDYGQSYTISSLAVLIDILAPRSNQTRVSRRSFLKCSAIGCGWISAGLFASRAATFAALTQSGPNIIGPREGFSPQIGTLVSMLEWIRSAILKPVQGLSMVDLDYLHDAKANTIGALLLHLAATERHYQIHTFEGKKWNDWDQDTRKQWDVPAKLGEEARRIIKGKELGYYVNALAEMRERSLSELRKRDDAWLMQIDENWPWGPTNNYCKWFHVCEHESHHNGQVTWIKARLPAAKQSGD